MPVFLLLLLDMCPCFPPWLSAERLLFRCGARNTAAHVAECANATSVLLEEAEQLPNDATPTPWDLEQLPTAEQLPAGVPIGPPVLPGGTATKGPPPNASVLFAVPAVCTVVLVLVALCLLLLLYLRYRNKTRGALLALEANLVDVSEQLQASTTCFSGRVTVTDKRIGLGAFGAVFL
eukprot:gene10005-8876_t